MWLVVGSVLRRRLAARGTDMVLDPLKSHLGCLNWTYMHPLPPMHDNVSFYMKEERFIDEKERGAKHYQIAGNKNHHIGDVRCCWFVYWQLCQSMTACYICCSRAHTELDSLLRMNQGILKATVIGPSALSGCGLCGGSGIWSRCWTLLLTSRTGLAQAHLVRTM